MLERICTLWKIHKVTAVDKLYSCCNIPCYPSIIWLTILIHFCLLLLSVLTVRWILPSDQSIWSILSCLLLLCFFKKIIQGRLGSSFLFSQMEKQVWIVETYLSMYWWIFKKILLFCEASSVVSHLALKSAVGKLIIKDFFYSFCCFLPLNRLKHGQFSTIKYLHASAVFFAGGGNVIYLLGICKYCFFLKKMGYICCNCYVQTISI